MSMDQNIGTLLSLAATTCIFTAARGASRELRIAALTTYACRAYFSWEKEESPSHFKPINAARVVGSNVLLGLCGSLLIQGFQTVNFRTVPTLNALKPFGYAAAAWYGSRVLEENFDFGEAFRF